MGKHYGNVLVGSTWHYFRIVGTKYEIDISVYIHTSYMYIYICIHAVYKSRSICNTR